MSTTTPVAATARGPPVVNAAEAMEGGGVAGEDEPEGLREAAN